MVKKKSPSYPSPSLLVSTPEAPSGNLFLCLLLEVAHALQVFSLKIIVIKLNFLTLSFLLALVFYVINSCVSSS